MRFLVVAESSIMYAETYEAEVRLQNEQGETLYMIGLDEFSSKYKIIGKEEGEDAR